MQCQNNLKQIGLALLNYESNYGTFPPGGMGPITVFPSSWWVRILAYAEQNNMYDRYKYSTGGWTGDGGNPNHDLVANKQFGFMYCPSSPLPWDACRVASATSAETHVASATYTGISGAIDHRTTQDVTEGVAGKVSLGGVLVPDRCIAISDISDGTTNTVVVGEQSDWLLPEADQRSDCGHGFPMGASLAFAYSGDRIFNLTTVRYAINMKTASSTGVGGNCGPNSPIQSVHSNGANVLFADGSVQFLSETIKFPDVWFDLCNRDDGHAIPGNAW
jgi:prepilin-type processing-associated H-X9-DG protein